MIVWSLAPSDNEAIKQNTDMNELNPDQLENITGGTQLQLKALNMIFNGGDYFRTKPISYIEMLNLVSLVKKRTGFKVKEVGRNSEGEVEFIYESPDGVIYNHDDFMDYIRANYTIEYLSGGAITD